MAIRGQRFHIPLDSEPEADETPKLPQSSIASVASPFSLISDITERFPGSSAKAPEPPRLRSSETGFPVHRKRTASKFKKSHEKEGQQSISLPAKSGELDNARTALMRKDARGDAEREAHVKLNDERQAIDAENQQRIAKMSKEEVEKAQKEIYEGLSPAMIERLRRRANIDHARREDVEGPSAISTDKPTAPAQPIKHVKSVTFAKDSIPSPDTTTTTTSSSSSSLSSPSSSFPSPSQSTVLPPEIDQDALPPTFNLEDALSRTEPKPPSSTRITPQPPTLDPSSPNFLSDLHSTYFPSLPSNPATLSWMQPPSPTSEELSSYSPNLKTLTPSAIRFDFSARLLPPSVAANIPPSKGLHHHSSAPEAAGYTIPELAHLARSSVIAQKCMAMQTLGRILYKLGTGEYGRGRGDEGKVLVEGLWDCVRKGRVVDTITEAAGKEKPRTAWVVGNEAVWLWRRGGGREP